MLGRISRLLPSNSEEIIRRVNHTEGSASLQYCKYCNTQINASVSIDHNDFAPFNAALQEIMCDDIRSFMNLLISKFSLQSCP